MLLATDEYGNTLDIGFDVNSSEVWFDKCGTLRGTEDSCVSSDEAVSSLFSVFLFVIVIVVLYIVFKFLQSLVFKRTSSKIKQKV